jgi:hypothetical protein
VEDGHRAAFRHALGREHPPADSQPAVVSIYGELVTPPPPPETLRDIPTLLLYAPNFGLVRDEQIAAYDGAVDLVAVPGMHMVMWDAFDETATAVEQFLRR